MENKNNLIIEKRQIRWCGTDYYVENVPYDMSDEEVIRACGETPSMFVNRYERRGTSVRFNVNYD